MTDYSELVKFLRGLSPWAFPDASNKRMRDAAAAIEALQAQMPKRGEWVELGYQPNVHETRYRCSLCGRQVLILSGSGELLKTYPYCNCGAKMEVHDESAGSV